ncbi:hypothetical protein PRZ48_012849 [Zasmidium cellare]|uniref:Aminotransferase class I/classII large domain-containing protein n=1 Tax=Zasmidium cellare TaxID=395010 RepID=A0ABR0E2Z6_ZASCE|nr:hypothetical protein PRZ48_012849 [Zasmidium cellare]
MSQTMGDIQPQETFCQPPEPILSDRVKDNLQPSKLGDLRAYCYYKQYDPKTKPDGIVALAIAENKLMRDEITKHINDNFQITPWHLTYGEGPVGTAALRKELTSYVNDAFKPYIPVKDDHFCMCNGAGNAVHNLAFCVGEPGDGILLSKPLYTGFFSDLEAGAKIKVVQVPMGGVDPVSPRAADKFEEALLESERAGTRIRAILIPNPHNPLGRPYDEKALIPFLRLCSKYNIHLISDEVYAQSWFPSDDFQELPPFKSILSLDLKEHINPALVHVIYAMSKDFCANGIRIGCLISPFNPDMISAFKSITGFTRPSQLAEEVWLNLLKDKRYLESYFPELRERMADSYAYTTRRLREYDIPYSAASFSPCVWIDLSRYLDDDSEEAELALAWRLVKAKVWLAMGAIFGSEKHGNYRITFATPRQELALGLDRMFEVLDGIRKP